MHMLMPHMLRSHLPQTWQTLQLNLLKLRAMAASTIQTMKINLRDYLDQKGTITVEVTDPAYPAALNAIHDFIQATATTKLKRNLEVKKTCLKLQSEKRTVKEVPRTPIGR